MVVEINGVRHRLAKARSNESTCAICSISKYCPIMGNRCFGKNEYYKLETKRDAMT